MNTEDLDFSKLKYKVHELEEGVDPLSVYDDLKKYPEFYEAISLPRKKVLRYIIYFYDKGSPLRDEEVYRGKIIAATLAGFETGNEGKFADTVEQMMLCRDFKINAMVIRFISMPGMFDVKWQKYIVLQQVYFRQSKDLYSGDEDDIKKFAATEKELNLTQSDLLNRDSADELLARLQKYYLEEKVELRPEDIAAKLLSNPNELPV